MDQLPLELHLRIFRQLGLSDLMSLRLVCKKFEYIVRGLKIRELVFVKNENFLESISNHFNEFSEFWFTLNETKDLRAIFSFSRYLLSSSFFLGGPFNVRSLKRLSIYSLNDAQRIQLEDINRFQQLQELEIGFDRQTHKDLGAKQVLSLPNLKALQIVSYYNQNGIEIDAPNLWALKLPNNLQEKDFKTSGIVFDNLKNDISSLQFKHPGSIRFLTTSHMAEHQNYDAKFSKVEYLQRKFSYVELEPILAKFPNLRRLNLLGDFLLGFSIKEFIRIANLVSALQKPNLKVYFLDIEISNDRKLIADFKFHNDAFEKTFATDTLCSECKSDILALQLKNYRLLKDRAENVQILLYDDLIDIIQNRGCRFRDGTGPANKRSDSANRLANHLPVNFFRRYTAIVAIITEKRIEDEEYFRRFVENCKNLRALNLGNSEMSQSFFDELPAISLLDYLCLDEPNELNMHFLSRMHQLIRCVTNQQLTVEMVLKLAKTRYSRKLGCKIQSKSVCIRKNTTKEYCLTIDSVEELVDFESLTEHLNRLENF